MSGDPANSDQQPARKIVRAAQYARMSTDHQRYSIENQADVISKYADARGMAVVRTYADDGKSGLNIGGREALRRLIDDVEAGGVDFEVVLVYDISRWGRFQDQDESAYYEYRCRRAGIQILYCAEQFENDGTPFANLAKSFKRSMAGEYSRELSVKVFNGQCRLIRLGFRQGGSAGYGLRRQLVDEHGAAKAELSRGQQKSLQTDRVVLAPGPPAEVELVQRLYRMFVVQRRSEGEIAAQLNVEGSLTDLGRPWTRGVVHQVLTNEKYIGNNVFNRISYKLKQKRVTNPPDQWVKAEGVFAGIIDRDFFDAAQRIIQDRSRRFNDDELLKLLSGLLAEKGWLSGLVIDEVEDMPSSSTFRHRFGSLVRAYQLVGYAPSRDYRYLETNRALRALHPNIVADVIAQIEGAGGAVRRDPINDLLRINEEFSASVVIVRCHETAAGGHRWKVRLDSGLRPDITIVARMAPGNEAIRDFYLLPWIDVGTALNLRLAPDNGVRLDAYRFDTLDPFFDLTRRTPHRRAA